MAWCHTKTKMQEKLSCIKNRNKLEFSNYI